MREENQRLRDANSKLTITHEADQKNIADLQKKSKQLQDLEKDMNPQQESMETDDVSKQSRIQELEASLEEAVAAKEASAGQVITLTQQLQDIKRTDEEKESERNATLQGLVDEAQRLLEEERQRVARTSQGAEDAVLEADLKTLEVKLNDAWRAIVAALASLYCAGSILTPNVALFDPLLQSLPHLSVSTSDIITRTDRFTG